jgi:YfiH family protein
VVAAAHAGRRGLAAGVLTRTLAAMVELGADPGRVEAALGPAAGGCCYEVPAAMRDDVEAAVPGSAATTTWGTPALDLRAGAGQQLAALGVRDVRVVGGCTIEDPTLYSFRRDRVTGRFAGVVVCPA